MLMACNPRNVGPHGLMPSLRGGGELKSTNGRGRDAFVLKESGAVRQFDTVLSCPSRLSLESLRNPKRREENAHPARAAWDGSSHVPNVPQIEEQCCLGLPWQCTCNPEFIQMNPT